MRKMGNFKGLPVFMVTDPFEWEAVKINHSHEEKIYVYRTNVYYKRNRIAAIDGDTLLDFNEELFNELRRKSWDDDRAQMLAHVTGFAETRPQEEEKPVKKEEKPVKKEEVKPVNENSDPAAAVDSFMSNWEIAIDYEITKMKRDIVEMGLEYNAVG